MLPRQRRPNARLARLRRHVAPPPGPDSSSSSSDDDPYRRPPSEAELTELRARAAGGWAERRALRPRPAPPYTSWVQGTSYSDAGPGGRWARCFPLPNLPPL
jgi:hypothetical protein